MAAAFEKRYGNIGAGEVCFSGASDTSIDEKSI